MYKACIFDLDGTLTDSLESMTYSVNETLKELGLGQISSAQCMNFAGNGARRLIELSLQAAGDSQAESLDKALELYLRIFEKNCNYQVAPYDGIVEMLQTLKEKGILLAVLSNKPHLQARDVVSTYFAEGTFTQVYGQQDGVPRKPDPTAVHIIMDEFNVSKEECLYIGDSDVDIQTGLSAGTTTVGVTWGFRSREVLIKNGATILVDKPEEIISIVLDEQNRN